MKESKTTTVRDKANARTILFNMIGGEVVTVTITYDYPRPLSDFISVDFPRVSAKEFVGSKNGTTT
jgi:hypothetical protein